MNRILQLLLVPVLLVGFMACNNKHEKERMAANDLKNYVDSVNNSAVEYTQEGWVAINKGYEDKMGMITDSSILTANEKEELVSTTEKYNSLKAKYEEAINKQKEAVSARQKLRNNLFGEGTIGDDMSFSFVTAGNILSTYVNFVDAVAKNKDNYSREDWDEIKVLYEALDTRKNEVEKDLATKDNLKIAQQKIRFSAIKSFNRPAAKAEENKDAKQ